MSRFPYNSKRGDLKMPEQVQQVVETLPPGRIGVYLLKDAEGRVLRVGYSKDLRERIPSYFRAGASGWPSKVESVELVLAESEQVAQLLEKQLIGEYQPPHNVHHNPVSHDAKPVDPVRTQLIGARRNQILDAAAAVFADKGFDRATTKEIAQAAGVAEGTIYNYFTNKFDLLVGLMSRIAEVEQLPSELAEAMNTGVRDFLVAAFQHRMGRIEQGQEMLKAVLPQVFVNPDLRGQFYEQYVLRIATLLENYVQAQIEQGRIRPVNVSLTARMVQAMFVGLLVMRILGDEPLHSDWDEVPELLATMIFDGLSSETGG